ncbi:spermidine/putrescine transport system substrate-binding protein [Gemmobacter aquatilis]|uniref:Spermidine/putrescine transport system substrate-binding protein n=1 Tax=Gemmobacter aquatilis TaxID=933059 RepID=A0A1H8FCP6_9RHOB|nr:extracellular solute-binding protein [Gemmobacter aquatilis]SEN29661.1 spermidine/putrescine transport system substrate-binding protein [Gemmobacter aquatilis]
MNIRTALLSSLALAVALPAFAADPDLTVLDWSGWDIPEVLTGYKEKNGDIPTYSFFADDDEAFQKASSGFRADIGHPCAASVGRYRDADLIEPWDTSKIPEFANIAPRMLNSSIFKDDKGVWFVPTDYAYTAIAYNTKEVPAEDVKSLKVFTDPKYAGRISMPDSTDDVWSLAFLATGVTSWDNVTDEQFKVAADWLRSVHPNVRAYWADPAEMAQLMATGEVLVAWSWNDGVAALQAEEFPVGFERSPAEGVATWFCGYVNFKDGPGKEEKAYDFINSLLAPSSAEGLLNALGYALSNDKAMATVPEDKLKEHFVDPVTTTLLPQTPVSQEFRTKMIEEFEAIKAGF